MKKIMLILGVSLVQVGCAAIPQSKAIEAAAERGEYEGLDKDSNFYSTFPASHSGPYSSVDLFNFRTGDGQLKDKKMSAILGKSEKTGEWEILMLMTNVSGQWTVLPINK